MKLTETKQLRTQLAQFRAELVKARYKLAVMDEAAEVFRQRVDRLEAAVGHVVARLRAK